MKPATKLHVDHPTDSTHPTIRLAETQATAAQVEADELARQVRQLTEELDAERVERDAVLVELASAQRELAIVERDKAVAEAQVSELHAQIEQERVEQNLLSSRIGALEADREIALTAMGWWSRQRYRRHRAAASQK